MNLVRALKALLLVLRQQCGATLVRLPSGQHPVVILDQEGADVIKPLLPDFGHIVLSVRGESLYFSPKIVARTLRNLTRLRNPLAAYSLAVIETVRPRLVITLIDNSGIYHAIRRFCPHINFVAIQNGARCVKRDNSDGSPIRHDHFVCFGRAHEEAYRTFGAHVDHYHPLGSLRDAFYRETFKRPANIEYDLCLISEVEPELAQLHPRLWQGIELLARHLARYCKESGCRIGIAMRADRVANAEQFFFEEEFFKTTFAGTEYTMIGNVRAQFRSYRAVDSSRLSLSVYSTLGLESFGRGNRTLFFNATGLDDYDPPERGLWTLDEPGYAEFQSRVDQMLTMSDEDYLENQKYAAPRLMAVLHTPLLQGPLRKLIVELADNNRPSLAGRKSNQITL